ncbi:hypothetical protein [Rhizobium sp. S163]|uniref:hypothetical protein n=1 Tax=Rhizobium sp. S163 TaxID=3055039 RepID=UPI0025A9A1E0|nr:hypothetical protein [Rhizobium sp. S163]MDM9647112.1 hypothetical protein [Rhizobium sp. S163]
MEHFKNEQWIVNEFGLQSRSPAPTYEIAANRLLERGDKGLDVYNWPMQVCSKSWVDKAAFIEAYRNAIEAHRQQDVDMELLEKSIAIVEH